MKIYNKKEFISGLFAMSLGSFELFMRIREKTIDLKTMILMSFLLIGGFYIFSRSLSFKKFQKDKLENLDERNILIKLKSQSKSFQLTRKILIILPFILIIVGKKAGYEELIPIGIGTAIAYIILMCSELVSYIYYEVKH